MYDQTYESLKTSRWQMYKSDQEWKNKVGQMFPNKP